MTVTGNSPPSKWASHCRSNEEEEEEEQEEEQEKEQEAPLLSSSNHVNNKRKRVEAPSSFPSYKVHK